MSNDNPVGNRGAAYIRVSHGEKQDPERQRESIRAWTAKRGLAVSAWHEDVKGRNPRDKAEGRREFQRLIQDVQAGRVDWIVVDSQDRFGVRDQFEYGFYAHLLRQHDCQLWSVSQGLLTSTDDATVFTTTVGNVTSTREQREKGLRSLGAKRRLSALGEWQGGHVPLGYDVACVDRATGKERWRVVILKMVAEDGVWQRMIVHEDGRQERCDGKSTFPRHQDWEKLVLSPSIVTERVEIIGDIFRLFATGAWTLRGLCGYLNKRQVDPVTGKGWYPTRLRPLLQNPVYHVGATVYGKYSHGRHAWYVGGQVLVPPSVKGCPKAGRRNNQADWVIPPAGQALIDRELWEAVQAKFANSKPAAKRGLRDDRLWLAGLLICERCGKPMTGWSQGGPHYTCTTYRKFGKENPTRCRLHRVRHDAIEGLVKRYVKEAGPDVKALLKSNLGHGPLTKLFWEAVDCDFEIDGVYHEIRSYLESRTTEGSMRECSRQELIERYCRSFDQDRQHVAEALQKKEEHLATVISNLNVIPLSAREARRIQGTLIVQLDREVAELRCQMTPLTDRLEALSAELVRLDRSLTEASEALLGEDARMKAQLLRQVLERIVLKFDHLEQPTLDRRSKNATLARTRLARVDFVPVSGNPQTFTLTSSPGPG